MRVAIGLVLLFGCTSAASAQTYIGASFIGDIVRQSGQRDLNPGNGETFGGALRVGTTLGSQWGVEFEFARTGEIDVSPTLAAFSRGSFTVTSSSADEVFPIQTFPAFTEISAQRQLATLSTMLFWQHSIGDRVTLAYLGGVSFTRVDSRLRIDYEDIIFPPSPLPGFPLPLPRPRPTIESESVTYDADVAVGFEGRIGMTEHVKLVPGIRLQTAAGGWTLRPGIGLHWQF
jgi:hypothetical protein